MTKILHVIGGNQINGSVRISGAKNSVLPIMAATLLTEQEINIENAPKLLDTLTMIDLLRSLGGEVDFFSEQDLAHKAKICCSKIKNFFISESIVSKMRASCLVLGPLLSRFKDKVTLTFPGGCTIGARPIDMHLDGLREMGAEVEVRDGVIEASARQGLSGAHIKFRSASVGATENVLMAATLARGRTIIENAAMEPEILANMVW